MIKQFYLLFLATVASTQLIPCDKSDSPGLSDISGNYIIY